MDADIPISRAAILTGAHSTSLAVADTLDGVIRLDLKFHDREAQQLSSYRHRRFAGLLRDRPGEPAGLFHDLPGAGRGPRLHGVRQEPSS